MDLHEMRKDITRLVDDIKYHSDALTPHHQLPIIQLNIILAKMNKMIEKTIVLKHLLEEKADKNKSDKAEADENEGQSQAEKITETTEKIDVAEKMQSQPIPDLKTAIGIYERYLYANELFSGSIEAYDEAISALNDFEDLEKATYYIEQGLMKEFDWDKENEFVVSFCTLIKRRYEVS